MEIKNDIEKLKRILLNSIEFMEKEYEEGYSNCNNNFNNNNFLYGNWILRYICKIPINCPDVKLKFGGLNNTNIPFLYFQNKIKSIDYDDIISAYNFINETNDISLKEGLSGIGIVLIIFLYDFLDKDKVILEKISNKLSSLIILKNNFNLGLYNGILGIACFELLLVKKKQNVHIHQQRYDRIMEIIKFELNEFFSLSKSYEFPIQRKSKVTSPYLSNGLAGYLLLQIIADKYEKNYDHYLKELTKVKWTSHCGLLNGLTGIMLVIALYYQKEQVYNWNDYIENIKTYMVPHFKKNNIFMIPSLDYSHYCGNIANGSSGIYLSLKYIESGGTL